MLLSGTFSHLCKFILEVNKSDEAFSRTLWYTCMHIVVTENTMKLTEMKLSSCS